MQLRPCFSTLNRPWLGKFIRVLVVAQPTDVGYGAAKSVRIEGLSDWVPAGRSFSPSAWESLGKAIVSGLRTVKFHDWKGGL